MPTFFFDTDIEGEHSVDTDGVHLPDVRSATREARIALYELAAELEAERELALVTMRVRDGQGATVVTLVLNVSMSAAATEFG